MCHHRRDLRVCEERNTIIGRTPVHIHHSRRDVLACEEGNTIVKMDSIIGGGHNCISITSRTEARCVEIC